MYNRWFNVAVVLLWLATMTWLVTQKVLPGMLLGRPPSYRTILRASANGPPVGWTMSWNGRPIGWALSTTAQRPDGVSEIDSQVHFDELPLEEMAPRWTHTFLKLLDNKRLHLAMDTKSNLIIDPLGRLSKLESSVRFARMTDVIKVQGVVKGAELMLSVRSGDFSYTTVVPVRSNTLLGDSLSPQTKLPGLRVGQTWEVRTFNPLRPPNNPLEILQATVDEIRPITWRNRRVDAFVVEQRSTPGSGLSSARSRHGRLWVARDGTVLKQEIAIFNSTMLFVRMADDQAAVLAEEVEREQQKVFHRSDPKNGI